MAWTNIPDVDVEAGGIPKGSTVTALRDNVPALANRDAGAPKLQTDFQFLSRAVLSNDATADFTAFDGTKYDAYTFVLSNVVLSTDVASLWIRTSTDGGSTYDTGASDYSYKVNNSTLVNGNAIVFASLMGSASGEDGWSGTATIHGPHIATDRTQTIFVGGYTSSNGALENVYGVGRRNAAADVDAVRFLASSGNLESGTITMYGMRND